LLITPLYEVERGQACPPKRWRRWGVSRRGRTDAFQNVVLGLSSNER
jgi:hypothetical protein